VTFFAASSAWEMSSDLCSSGSLGGVGGMVGGFLRDACVA
jgi:hypothetical protein